MNPDFLKYVIQKDIPDIGVFSAQVLNYGPFVRSLFVPVRLGEMRDVVLGLARIERYPRWMEGAFFTCLQQEEDRLVFAPAESGDSTMTLSLSLHRDSSGASVLRLEGGLPSIYFNLMGHGVLNILDHRLMVNSCAYLPHGRDLSSRPLGFADDLTIADRHGDHPLDFRREHLIKEAIRVGHPELRRHHGYDSVYVLDDDAVCRNTSHREDDGGLPAARLTDFYYGLTMEVWTNAPLLLVETANRFSGRDLGRGGCIYPVHGGIQLKPLSMEGLPLWVEYRFFMHRDHPV